MISVNRPTLSPINLILFASMTVSISAIMGMEKSPYVINKEEPHLITITNCLSKLIYATPFNKNNPQPIRFGEKVAFSITPQDGVAYIKITLPHHDPSYINLGISKQEDHITIKGMRNIFILNGEQQITTMHTKTPAKL